MKKAPLEQKDYLTPEETIQLFNLSRRKFLTLIRSGPLDFIIMFRSRRLIVRKEFEKYLNQGNRKEELANANISRRKT